MTRIRCLAKFKFLFIDEQLTQNYSMALASMSLRCMHWAVEVQTIIFLSWKSVHCRLLVVLSSLFLRAFALLWQAKRVMKFLSPRSEIFDAPCQNHSNLDICLESQCFNLLIAMIYEYVSLILMDENDHQMWSLTRPKSTVEIIYISCLLYTSPSPRD